MFAYPNLPFPNLSDNNALEIISFNASNTRTWILFSPSLCITKLIDKTFHNWLEAETGHKPKCSGSKAPLPSPKFIITHKTLGRQRLSPTNIAPMS